MNHRLALVAAAAAIAHAALAQAVPDRSELAGLSVEELKSSYLQCDRRTTVAFLDAGEAAGCSVLYEELKQRVFGGDFERLLDWWQGQRTARTSRFSISDD